MKIEVLSGCSTCSTLLREVQAAVEAKGVVAQVIRVDEDMASIMQYGAIATPALVIDGKVVFSGRTPTVAEIQEHL